MGKIKLGKRAVTGSGHPALAKLARAAALCNDASLHEHDGVWTVEGDPMEGALLAFAGHAGLPWSEEQKAWARTDAIPFDSKHRFIATLHHYHRKHAFVLKARPNGS